MLSPDTARPIEKVYEELIFLKNFITNPNIQVGDYTYYDGREEADKFEKNNVVFGKFSKLTIGKFCQIAYGTKFILNDANHHMNGFSTYPFYVFGEYAEGCPEWGNYEPDFPKKGDTFIGNDVWFGHESKILPGVTIGDGAIIGTAAVVTKDVPPYAIVAGNPAKIIRMRFSKEIIDQLLEIQWWNWDYSKISANIKYIVEADIEKLKEA